MAAGNAKTWGAVLLAVIAIAVAGCGSDDEAPAEAASLDPAVAERLAERSEAIAASLDSGDVCGAAGEADDLAREVSDAEMPKELRAEAEAAAAELVNAVNCEPEPVEEEKPPKPEKPKKDKDDDDKDDEEEGSGPGPGPPGQEGGLPPGLEKHGGGGSLE